MVCMAGVLCRDEAGCAHFGAAHLGPGLADGAWARCEGALAEEAPGEASDDAGPVVLRWRPAALAILVCCVGDPGGSRASIKGLEVFFSRRFGWWEDSRFGESSLCFLCPAIVEIIRLQRRATGIFRGSAYFDVCEEL
ncbi:hypothetical protein Taro_018036 [Colocasia esculenta]|uniref:Uncharacterized protein n=1 Tax=Colocasia esculenta TaxID=4460 RepID=A0A843USV6_COLES|nr:hypothetical protein [Colocasia esculenta]